VGKRSRSRRGKSERKSRSRGSEKLDVAGYLVVFLVLCLFELGVAGASSLVVPDLGLAWESRNWPATEGTLIHKELKRRRKSTVLSVRYRYAVDEIEQVGATISFAGHSHGQASRDLGVGSPVRVYYHPQRPSLAVLYPGILTATTITITAMLTLGAAAILGWLGFGISSLIGRSR
jgi:hypothetical protein